MHVYVYLYVYVCIGSYPESTCKYIFIHVASPQAEQKWKLEKDDPHIERSGTGPGETLRPAVNGIPFTRGSKARVAKRSITAVQDIDASAGSMDLICSNKFMRIHAAQGLDNPGFGRLGAVFQPGAASGSLLTQAQDVDMNIEMATSKELNLKIKALPDVNLDADADGDAWRWPHGSTSAVTSRTCPQTDVYTRYAQGLRKSLHKVYTRSTQGPWLHEVV